MLVTVKVGSVYIGKQYIRFWKAYIVRLEA